MIIVAGVDDSDHARQVLKRAIQEATTKSADLHVVHPPGSGNPREDRGLVWVSARCPC